MEEEIRQYVHELFPCPQISEVWIAKTTERIQKDGGPVPDDSFDEFINCMEQLVLDTPFSVSAERGTGMQLSLSLPTMCKIIPGPVVWELSHLTDIGVSAFALDRVRCNREQSFHQRLHALAAEGEVATEQRLADIRTKLPHYPRKCLKLHLSDGARELQAVETEPLDIYLGGTPMGTKVQLSNFPVISGVAYLRPENVCVLGGRVEAWEHQHQCRLAGELYARMQHELVIAKARAVRVAQLFAD